MSTLTGMEYAREKLTDKLLDEMYPLWKDHHEEVPGIEGIPLDPNFDVYRECDSRGVLRIYTIRHFNNLHGYQVFMVGTHPHSKHSIQAIQDILYLCPDIRRGFTASQFIKWCCECLRDEGVNVVYQYISARRDFGKVLERIGYELQDLVYSRKLN